MRYVQFAKRETGMDTALLMALEERAVGNCELTSLFVFFEVLYCSTADGEI